MHRSEESNVTLGFITCSSSDIVIIKTSSSIISGYFVSTSSLIDAKWNIENIIVIFTEKSLLLKTSTHSTLELLVYLKILIRLSHAENFLCTRFYFISFLHLFQFVSLRFKNCFAIFIALIVCVLSFLENGECQDLKKNKYVLEKVHVKLCLACIASNKCNGLK